MLNCESLWEVVSFFCFLTVMDRCCVTQGLCRDFEPEGSRRCPKGQACPVPFSRHWGISLTRLVEMIPPSADCGLDRLCLGGGSLLQSQLLSVAQDFLNFHFPSKFIVLVMGVWRICTWRERLYPISQKNLSGKDGVYKPLEGFLSYVYCVTLRGCCVSQVASRYRIDRVYV